MTARTLILVSLAWSMPACLSARDGHRAADAAVDTVVAADTVVDTVPDTVVDTTADTVVVCPAPVQCVGDADCDDGNPCTENRCVVTVGCGGGSVCTADPIADCGARCNGQGLSSVDDIVWGGLLGQFVKVANTVAPSWYTDCDDSVCGACSGEPAIGDSDQLRLLPGPEMTLKNWSCIQHKCGEAPDRCEPVHLGAGYWLWGQATNRMTFFAGEEPAGRPLYADTIEVYGFCLQTNAAGLPGNYSVEVSVDGRTVTSEATIAEDGVGDFVLEILAGDCPHCPHATWPGQSLPLFANDGFVTVPELFVPSTISGWLTDASVTLWSAENTLSGELTVPMAGHAETDGDGVPDPPASGWLTLQRLQP